MNKADRTRSMRYKRPALVTLGYETIMNEASYEAADKKNLRRPIWCG
jgi:hypothetical protein